MRLGPVIAGYRWANRIDLRDLAKEIGTSPSTLSRFENCKSSGDGETLAKILKWLLAEKRGTGVEKKRNAS